MQVVVRAERASEFPEDTSTALCDETGHVAWQAMPVLCHFILSAVGQRLLTSARVLELGAGIGVPGLLAGRVCREVILTDNNDAVLERLQRNVKLNMTSMSCSPDAVRVLNVAWGADYFPPEHVLARHSVDVVLGSDVVYSAASARAFLETAKMLVTEPDGVIVLAYIPRWQSVDRALHDALQQENLEAEVVPLNSFLPTDGDLSSDKTPLPKGTCLLLVRSSSCHSSGITSDVCDQSSSPMSLQRLASRTELCIGPQHVDDSLAQSCYKAGVDPRTISAISLEVDATGPVSITAHQAKALSRALCQPPLTRKVTELRLRECWLGHEGWSWLAPGILEGCAQTLSLLSAVGDEIGHAAASTIADVLLGCPRLTSLHLTHNPLDNAGGIALARGLASSNLLCSLTLSHCNIGDAGLMAIANAIPHSLLELDMSNNQFSALGLADLATALKLAKTPTLTRLNISGNDVGPGGGAELAEALSIGTPQLEHLDLRGCFLTDLGLAWLSGALPLCKSIRVLHLGSNGVGDEGVAALAAVLPSCRRLHHLGLAMNSISGEENVS